MYVDAYIFFILMHTHVSLDTFLELDFWLVFIPNTSIFPESGLNLHSSSCWQSLRKRTAGGKGRLSGTCSTMDGDCEDPDTQTILGQSSHPAAPSLTSNNPLE